MNNTSRTIQSQPVAGSSSQREWRGDSPTASSSSSLGDDQAAWVHVLPMLDELELNPDLEGVKAAQEVLQQYELAVRIQEWRRERPHKAIDDVQDIGDYERRRIRQDWRDVVGELFHGHLETRVPTPCEQDQGFMARQFQLGNSVLPNDIARSDSQSSSSTAASSLCFTDHSTTSSTDLSAVETPSSLDSSSDGRGTPVSPRIPTGKTSYANIVGKSHTANPNPKLPVPYSVPAPKRLNAAAQSFMPTMSIYDPHASVCFPSPASAPDYCAPPVVSVVEAPNPEFALSSEPTRASTQQAKACTPSGKPSSSSCSPTPTPASEAAQLDKFTFPPPVPTTPTTEASILSSLSAPSPQARAYSHYRATSNKSSPAQSKPTSPLPLAGRMLAHTKSFSSQSPIKDDDGFYGIVDESSARGLPAFLSPSPSRKPSKTRQIVDRLKSKERSQSEGLLFESEHDAILNVPFPTLIGKSGDAFSFGPVDSPPPRPFSTDLSIERLASPVGLDERPLSADPLDRHLDVASDGLVSEAFEVEMNTSFAPKGLSSPEPEKMDTSVVEVVLAEDDKDNIPLDDLTCFREDDGSSDTDGGERQALSSDGDGESVEPNLIPDEDGWIYGPPTQVKPYLAAPRIIHSSSKPRSGQPQSSILNIGMKRAHRSLGSITVPFPRPPQASFSPIAMPMPRVYPSMGASQPAPPTIRPMSVPTPTTGSYHTLTSRFQQPVYIPTYPIFSRLYFPAPPLLGRTAPYGGWASRKG